MSESLSLPFNIPAGKKPSGLTALLLKGTVMMVRIAFWGGESTYMAFEEWLYNLFGYDPDNEVKNGSRYFKADITFNPTEIVIWPNTVMNGRMAPIHRRVDEFDHIDVLKEPAYERYRIAFRAADKLNDDLVFDQPGKVRRGEAHARDFARRLGKALRLKTNDNEWEKAPERDRPETGIPEEARSHYGNE